MHSLLSCTLALLVALTHAQAAPTRQQLATFCQQDSSTKYAACTLMLRAGCETDESKPYCNTLSLYQSLCGFDNSNSTLNGVCQPYTSFCAANAQQCDANKAWPNWVNSTMFQFQVQRMCRVHKMEGCDRCPTPANSPTAPLDNCDSLATYAVMCKAMPDMSMCAVAWKPMCNALPNSPSVFPSICTASALSSPDPSPAAPLDPPDAFESIPPMRMYFHQDVEDLLLFRAWFTRNATQYWLAALGILLLSIGFSGFSKLIRSDWIPRIDDKLAEIHSGVQAAGHQDGSSSQPADPEQPNTSREQSTSSPAAIVKREAWIGLRSFLIVIEVTWSYILMLIFMVYNWGWIAALLLGVFLGNCFFNRYIPLKKRSEANKADVLRQPLCC